jgi:hypothetical protein
MTNVRYPRPLRVCTRKSFAPFALGSKIQPGCRPPAGESPEKSLSHPTLFGADNAGIKPEGVSSTPSPAEMC